MTRLSRDARFMLTALVQATGATCARRKVGCVLVDARGKVLSTGYNGPASGEPHCIDCPCLGAKMPSGTGLDSCEAIHAEANALLQCHEVQAIDTCYVTASPCVHCVKMLMNTSCRRVVFLDEYPHPEARELWLKRNRDTSTAWSGGLSDIPQRIWDRFDPETERDAFAVESFKTLKGVLVG